MKRLIFICGANGIGKSTICKALNLRLLHSAYVDSDWCRMIFPFTFTGDTMDTIVRNTSGLLINYFQCESVESVIYSYGFHGPRKQIFDRILRELCHAGIEYLFVPILLECGLEENLRRMKCDNRSEQRISSAILATREIYNQYPYPRIDITGLSVDEAVNGILELLAR